jgi:Tol biopolymer transport system component
MNRSAITLLLAAAVGLPFAGCHRGKAEAKSALDVTGAVSSLERVTTEPLDETYPALSPDGKILLFGVGVQEGMISKRTIVGVNPNTRAQRTLYTSDKNHSLDPAWLMDGSSYLFISDSPGSASVVRALTDAPNAAIAVVAVGEVAPQPRCPTLSPDDKRVAFQTKTRGTDQIAIIQLDGSHLTLLGEGDSPSWSPDGLRIAFGRQVAGHHHLFAINPETGTELVQLTSGDFDHYDPAWSPDAKFIIFSSNRGSPEEKAEVSEGRNLFLINADGTGLTQVTAGTSHAITPYWAKDDWIYFASDQEGNYDIWRLRPSGKYAGLKPVGLAVQAPPAAAPPAATAPTKGAGSAAPAAASPPPPAGKPETAAPAAGGCLKDTDCKGERICEKGVCVTAPAPAAPPSKHK